MTTSELPKGVIARDGRYFARARRGQYPRGPYATPEEAERHYRAGRVAQGTPRGIKRLGSGTYCLVPPKGIVAPYKVFQTLDEAKAALKLQKKTQPVQSKSKRTLPTGVYICKFTGDIKAKIVIDGVAHHSSAFDSEDHAANWYAAMKETRIAMKRERQRQKEAEAANASQPLIRIGRPA